MRALWETLDPPPIAASAIPRRKASPHLKPQRFLDICMGAVKPFMEMACMTEKEAQGENSGKTLRLCLSWVFVQHLQSTGFDLQHPINHKWWHISVIVALR